MARSRSLRHQRLTSAQRFIPSIVQRRSPLIAIDRHWLISDRLSNRLVRELPVEAARHIIGAIGAVRPGMANLTRSVLSKVMAYAIETGSRRDNPFAGLKPYRLGTYHTWTDAEIAQFERRWPLGTRERLAFALLLYTGQRGGDVVKILRSDIIDSRIRVAQDKVCKGTTSYSSPSIPRSRRRWKAKRSSWPSEGGSGLSWRRWASSNSSSRIASFAPVR